MKTDKKIEKLEAAEEILTIFGAAFYGVGKEIAEGVEEEAHKVREKIVGKKLPKPREVREAKALSKQVNRIVERSKKRKSKNRDGWER